MPTVKKSAAAEAAKAAEGAFDAFNVNMPSMEVPQVLRDAAEKSVAQARDAYAKFKAVAEDTSEAIEETYETAREGAIAVGLKALDNAKVNAEASFSFFKDLMGAKTFADAVEIQTAFTRRQFDALSSQVKELQELTQKSVLETAKPGRAVFEKAWQDLKIA